LLEARREAEEKLIATARIPVTTAIQTATAAAHGAVERGESSEKTRLRIFDKQMAKTLAGERVTAYATAGIALVICVPLAFLAHRQVQAAGGLTGLKDVTPAGLRQLGWSVFTDVGVTGMWLTLAAVSALLCLVGQGWRGIVAGRCIRAVEAGEKPLFVGISTTTKAGLLLFSFICPPVGLILGIVLKLRPHEETAALGGALMWAGFVALLAIVINLLWGMAEQIKTKPPPQRKPEDAVLLFYPLWATMCSIMGRRHRQ